MQIRQNVDFQNVFILQPKIHFCIKEYISALNKDFFQTFISEMLPEDNPPYDPSVDISDGNGNLASGWC